MIFYLQKLCKSEQISTYLNFLFSDLSSRHSEESVSNPCNFKLFYLTGFEVN